MIPSPHPLDFDWRFDAATLDRLEARLKGLNVLALGTPTIARRLVAKGQSVFLADRQPLQGIRDQLICELPIAINAPHAFDIAMIDPPWYPKELFEWTLMAANWVGVGRTVLVSAWPEETRPGADEQLRALLAATASWATVEEANLPIAYEIPPFEHAARAVSTTNQLAMSPARGRLLELRITATPPHVRETFSPPRWHRFVIDNYQLAVRLHVRTRETCLIKPHPLAHDWIWPFVSARALGLDEIGIWSSAGEVARISHSTRLIDIIRSAIHSADADAFAAALTPAPELASWMIPRPPYNRVLEWQHP